MGEGFFPSLLKQNEGTVRFLDQSCRTDETKPVSIKEECVGRNKGTTHDPKPPPCLSNVAVVLLQLRCVWLPMELAHWYLLEDCFACRSNRMNAGSFCCLFIKCSKTASSHATDFSADYHGFHVYISSSSCPSICTSVWFSWTQHHNYSSVELLQIWTWGWTDLISVAKGEGPGDLTKHLLAIATVRQWSEFVIDSSNYF